MAIIFEGAFLTLAASSAGSDDDGFLHDLPQDYKCHKLLYKPSKRISHEVFPGKTSHDLYEGDYDQPLLTRAWCYQERLLSARVLHFGPAELWWECRKGQRCQCGELEERGTSLVAGFSKGLEGPLIESIWTRMVETYSRLDVTNAKDKLPALSGIARKIQQATNDDYLAGHWRKDLAETLQWAVHPGEQREKPREWRAPSWSWASVDGQISFLGSHSGNLFEVIDCQTVQLGEDPTGQVRYGYIRVRCKISPTILYRDAETVGARVESNMLIWEDYHNDPEHLPKGSRDIVKLMVDKDSTNYDYLILRRIPGEEATFQRIAYARWAKKYSDAGFRPEAGEEKVITII